MSLVLAEMGVAREQVWLESDSLNTWQNATQSAAVLRAHGIGRILLVTEAFHIRRSVWCFEKQGLQVIAAPCEQAHRGLYGRGLFSIVPQSHNLFYSSRALEEWLGNLYYALRY